MISVIIPVYNREKLLESCVDSVLAQTLQELEIILVDDGSTDGSLALCRELEKKDSRIKTVSKQNGGVSSARNAGLDAATGDYIGFVDSDDLIDREMYDKMLAALVSTGADTVRCYYKAFNRNGFTGESSCPEPHGKLETIEKSELQPYFRAFLGEPGVGGLNEAFSGAGRHESACTSLTKTAVIRGNALRFDERYSFAEDAFFCLNVYACCNKIALLYEPLYLYRAAQSQNMRNVLGADTIKRYVSVWNMGYDFCTKFDVPESLWTVHCRDIAGAVSTFPKLLKKQGGSFSSRRAALAEILANESIRQAVRRFSGSGLAFRYRLPFLLLRARLRLLWQLICENA